MSATIATNDLSFFIFGSGHDYTRIDSGKGEVRWFSHPYMAKGSRAYAGMYYFLVPDENGNLIDAVKDDIEHCTFTPALGDTFNTVGEQEIRVDYYREYPHDEDTLVVEKHLKQTITVVDHGAVASSYFNNIIYADGYCYVNPASDYVSRYNGWWLSGSFKKISSLPWGTISIDNISLNLEDASEMGFADYSGMNSFKRLFKGCNKLTNISNFDLIDMSTIKNVSEMFYGCSSLVDITSLKTWKTSQITDFTAFLGGSGIINTDGLQNFDFSGTYTLEQFFYSCKSLTDLNGISDWDVSMIEEFIEMFANCTSLTDLTPLSSWDMTGAINVSRMFNAPYSGSKCGKLKKLDGLDGWDVSNIRVYNGMFQGQYWLTDISAVSDWDVSNGLVFDNMFNGVACADLSDISGWNLSNANSLTNMFDMSIKNYSSKISKYVLTWESSQYIDYEDTIYATYQVTPPALEPIEQDASAVSGWSVPNGSNAFNSGGTTTWENIPSWN